MGFLGRDRDPWQPGAYIRDDKVLFEVVGRTETTIDLENCWTFWRHSRPITDLQPASVMCPSAWKLVKAAPAVPDGLP